METLLGLQHAISTSTLHTSCSTKSKSSAAMSAALASERLAVLPGMKMSWSEGRLRTRTGMDSSCCSTRSAFRSEGYPPKQYCTSILVSGKVTYC